MVTDDGFLKPARNEKDPKWVSGVYCWGIRQDVNVAAAARSDTSIVGMAASARFAAKSVITGLSGIGPMTAKIISSKKSAANVRKKLSALNRCPSAKSSWADQPQSFPRK
jgi:hypothetical protein